MKPIIVLENIRSAYNAGNIIRTADALGYEVVLSGFTPRPAESNMAKTSLGAEDHVALRQFWNTKIALKTLRDAGYLLIAAELTETSTPLGTISFVADFFAVVVGNEKVGVLPETLDYVDHIVHIPMSGYKDSLNVAQAAAIMMRELNK